MSYNPEENIDLSTIKAGDNVESCYFLKSSAVKSTKQSTFYLDTILVDNSMPNGIPVKMWDISGDYEAPEAGNIVYVSFTAETYNGGIQGRLKKIIVINPDSINSEKLNKIVNKVLPTAPIDVEKEWKFVVDTINSIKDVGLRKLVSIIIKEVGIDNFKTVSAARGVHHWERSGLLWHTTEMLHIANGILCCYPSLDADIVRAGIILHDIEKIHEYLYSTYGLVSDFTVQGNLLGHLAMGAMLIDRFGRDIKELNEETLLHLEGIVAQHHGKKDYGAVQTPATPEALLVSEVDGMSAQLYQYIHIQNETEPGTFSETIRTLDGARIWHPKGVDFDVPN